MQTSLGTDIPFSPLLFLTEDVYLMNSKDPKNPIIYGVFTTSRYRVYHFTSMEAYGG